MSILFITHQNCLGDAVCSEPTVRGLTLKYPGEPFTVCTPTTEIFQDYPVPLEIVTDLWGLRGRVFDKTYVGIIDGSCHIVTYLAQQFGVTLPYEIPRNYGTFGVYPGLPKKYVVMSNDANDLNRRLEPMDFQSLVRYVESLGFPVVVTGRNRDIFGGTKCSVNLAGMLNPGRLGLYQVASHALFGVVSDSGLSHVLASFGIPYVAWSDVQEGWRKHGDLSRWVQKSNGLYNLEKIKSKVDELVECTGA